MSFFTRMMSYLTLGSSRPIRRLAAYYALLAIVGLVVFRFFPGLDGLLTGERLSHLAKAPAALLRDSISAGQSNAPPADLATRAAFGLSTAVILLSTLALMLPVTWVYMSARSAQGHNQSVVQVLIVLPMIVAGIVLIVSNSLALAFSLGGVVAAVRFRTNMSDSRDIVFIFLAIAVGFAAGVQDITIALDAVVHLQLCPRPDSGDTISGAPCSSRPRRRSGPSRSAISPGKTTVATSFPIATSCSR